jgi:AcrR family transcriptional regulator
MPNRRAPSLHDKLCAAALDLAARHPWSEITLAQIAKQAHVPLSRATELLNSTADLLPALVAQTDKFVAAQMDTVDLSESPHDRLFEIIMARFDYLQKHRAAVLSIRAACRRDPHSALLILRAQWIAMQKTLKLAGLAENSSTVINRTILLCAAYQYTLYRWRKDKTPDMAETMSALDQSLNRIADLSTLLSRRQTPH